MEKNSNSYKETFSFTIINYIGITIGIFSTLFLYPKNKEVIGLYRYVEGIAYVMYPFFVFGTSQSLINFNPKLNAYLKQRIFVYSLFTIIGISLFTFVLILLLSLFPIFKEVETIYFSFSIAFCMAIIEIFKKKATIAKKLTIPTLFDTLLPKIVLPILFLLVLKKSISIVDSLQLYALTFFIIVIAISFYLRKYLTTLTQLNFKPLFETIKKSEFYHFSLYAFAGSLGTIFAFRIDSIMIPMFLSMTENGNFSIAVSIVSAIAIPATGLFSLYSPIISKYMNDLNYTELNEKYKEISMFLFFVGVLLYSCLFLGIENFFLLLPTSQNLMSAVPIILILGFTILINMGTGFNSEIITYSNQFRFNLVAVAVLITTNITLNVVFLYYLKLEVKWVAIASLISMSLFNFVKMIFIYIKFKLFPFDYKYLLLIIASASVITFVDFIPDTISVLFNLVSKISLCLILNLVLIYRLRLVVQYNYLIDMFFAKMKRKIN